MVNLSLSLTSSLLACLIVAGSTGFIYDFSIYSGALKHHFHLNQSQLDWIATSSCLTFFLSPVSGHLVDTRGPRVGLLVAGLLMTSGLLLQYFFSTSLVLPQLRTYPSQSTVLLSSLAAMTAVGTNLAAAVAFSTPVRLYPKQRGIVTGIVKAFCGLTGGMLAQIYTLIVGVPSIQPSTLSFLLFLAVAVAFCNIVVAPWLFPPPATTDTSNLVASLSGATIDGKEDDILSRLHRAYVCVIVLILSIFVCSLLTAVPTTPYVNGTDHAITNSTTRGGAIIASQSPLAFVVAGVFLLLIFAVGAAVSISSSVSSSSSASSFDQQNSLLLDSVSSSDTVDTISSSSDTVSSSTSSINKHNVGTFKMLIDLNFWLVLCAGMSAVGGGYMITTNSFQMVRSSNIHSASAGTAISMFSACQGLARMFGGVGPDMLGSEKKKKTNKKIHAAAAAAASKRRSMFLAG